MSKPQIGSEAEALATMKAKITDIQDSAFSMIAHLERLTPTDLKSYGHTSIDAGILYTVRSAREKIERLHKEFFRAYPDK